MVIRRAKGEDYENLMVLYNQFVGQERYSDFENDSFEKVLQSPTNFIFVAEEMRALVGFVTFSVRNVVRYPKPIAELDEIFVAPGYQKRGIGRLLMQEVENEARNLGCYRLYIETAYKHEPAHGFYKNLGYTNYGYHFYKDL